MTKEQKIELAYQKYAQNAKIFRVCDLGSAQYQDANDLYTLIIELIDIMGIDDWEKSWGITHQGHDSLEDFEHDLYDTIIESNKSWEPGDDMIIPLTAKQLETQRVTIEDYYRLTRENAWDLWSAAMTPMKNFQIKQTEETRTKIIIFNGQSYSLFQILDEYDSGGGTYIAFSLAYTTHYFGTQLETFSNFDT